MAVQTQIQVRRGTASSWTSTNPTLAAGEIGFESDTGKFKIGTGSSTWNALAYTANGGIPESLIDAKGDLIVGSAADTAARLAVGSNGQTLVADSSQTTGLGWANNFAAGKNKIINGDFGVWQRGTSFSNPADGTYTADRWVLTLNGTGATRTISQQTFTAGTAPVSGYEGTYFYRYAISAVGTGNTYNFLNQRIEDVRQFAGQTITVSFWAKADAARSVGIQAAQIFGSGGSASVGIGGFSASLTTSWQRFSGQLTIPSIAGKTIGTGSSLEIEFNLPANTVMTLDFWGVQVEAGSVATSFQTATGTIQGELAACQRYYIRYTANGNYVNPAGMQGFANSGGFYLSAVLPVSMRVAPTSVEYSGLTTYATATNVFASGAAAIAIDNGPNSQNVAAVAVTNGTLSPTLVAGTFYKIIANNLSTAYLAFSAEL